MFYSCAVTVDAVRDHLRQMYLIYEETRLLTSIQLYESLLKVSYGYQQNFAAIVHMLHPRLYIRNQ